MPAYRGRTHDGESVAVTLSPFSLPAPFRQKSNERRNARIGQQKYSRLARLLIFAVGIVGSWSILLSFAIFVSEWDVFA